MEMEELKFLLDRLDELDGKLSGRLDSIHIQTTITNGRVNGLEKLVDDHKNDIESFKKIIGFNKGRDYVVIAIIGLFAGFVVSYIIGGGSEKGEKDRVINDKIENQIKTK